MDWGWEAWQGRCSALHDQLRTLQKQHLHKKARAHLDKDEVCIGGGELLGEEPSIFAHLGEGAALRRGGREAVPP